MASGPRPLARAVRLRVLLALLGRHRPNRQRPVSNLLFDSLGRLYVVDDLASQIKRVTPAGTIDLVWGSNGSADGQFNRPWGIAIDASGYVYVAEGYNHRVQKFAIGK